MRGRLAVTPRLEASPRYTRKLRLMSLSMHWRSVWAMSIAAATSGITTGLVPAVVSLNLNDRGISTSLIGFNSAMPFIALFCLGPFLPRIIHFLGALPAMLIGIFGNALLFLSFPFVHGVMGWFVLRFLTGATNALPWMVMEIWINRSVGNESRGKALALYVSLWGLGVALGPQIIGLVGYRGLPPFLIATVLMMMAALPPLMAHRLAPDVASGSGSGKWLDVCRSAPLPLWVAIAGGAGETSVFSMLPLYALQVWGDASVMRMALTVFAAGGFLLQLPGGWMSDRFGRFRTLLIYACMSLLGAVSLPWLGGSLFLWPVAFVWGGAVMGLYSVGLMLLGDKFSMNDLVQANTIYAMAFTVGSVIGPMLVGIAMRLSPAFGFPFAMALPFALVLALLARKRKTHGVA